MTSGKNRKEKRGHLLIETDLTVQKTSVQLPEAPEVKEQQKWMTVTMTGNVKVEDTEAIPGQMHQMTDGDQILAGQDPEELRQEAEFDKVRGLEAGADDYITKPFGMMEFVARVKAVLRRCSRQEDDKELKCQDLTLSVGKHKVCWKGEKIELTRKEFELLQYLMENKGLVMTRNQILCHVWGYDFDGETRTVDVHVRTLRQKLGEAGNLVETVRGVGYRIGA